MHRSVCDAELKEMTYRPNMVFAFLFLLALAFSIFYMRSEPSRFTRPSSDELDRIPLDELYAFYIEDINNSKPHDYSLSDPLAKRGSAAAYFMLRRLAE